MNLIRYEDCPTGVSTQKANHDELILRGYLKVKASSHLYGGLSQLQANVRDVPTHEGFHQYDVHHYDV